MRCKIILLAALLFCSSLRPALAELSKPDEARARLLINALGCKGCHKFEGDGGSLAPVLDQVGSRLSKEQIVDHLAAHASTRQTGFMPSYNTTEQEELKNLSEFLHSQR